MRNIFLAAGVAALAIAMPASAKPGNGGGNGKGGGGHAAQAQRGGGGGGHGGGGAKFERRGGGGGSQARFQMERHGGGKARAQASFERRGGGQRAMKMERRGGGNERAMRFAGFQERGHGKAQRVENRGKRFEARGNGKSEMRQMQRLAERNQFRGRDRNEQRIKMRGNDNRVAALRGRDRERFENRFDTRERNRFVEVRNNVRFGDRSRDFDRDDARRWKRIFGDRVPASFAYGCPPGLAKKSPACVPPGQARGYNDRDRDYRNMAFVGAALPSIYGSNVLPLGLRDLYRDNDDYYYRYGDGYVYRVDRDNNLVNSLLPLIGAGYGIGQPFPYLNNSNYYVPSYYQPFYQDNPYYDYRYENGYVYQIDPYNGYIDNMIPLLDRGYGVGQMLPASYSYYNVPYQYRDLYYDTDDYYYRYAPGAIYQVDPQSQLITSVASLLSPGLSVGQALPMGYDVYNVPYAYRDNYYDTNDAWYRYANGNVYQVDPTTRLVTAIVASLLT